MSTGVRHLMREPSTQVLCDSVPQSDDASFGQTSDRDLLEASISGLSVDQLSRGSASAVLVF